MKLLIIGDLVGEPGREALAKYLEYKRELFDFIVVNGENVAGGFGITPKIANKVFNLCYAVIPFLFLPYFGFRVVYAIYPIVLFYIIKNIATYRDGRRELIYLSVFFINIGLLFAWAVASKIMSETLLISVN